jgi:hypothetical protein
MVLKFQFERGGAQLKILIWKDLYPLLATYRRKDKLQAFALKRGKGNHVWEIDKKYFKLSGFQVVGFLRRQGDIQTTRQHDNPRT